jgi:signal transduction histidine kinase
MVVQAEGARSLLGHDPERADAAMDTIEDTGRTALAEMRRILGVLRHGDETGELAPQPGFEHVYALIQQARERGQPVELSVDGDAGSLAAGVELGLYRILENALQSATEGAVAVALRFGAEDLELRLVAHCQGPSGWPTAAMRERVALCGGELENDVPEDKDSWRLGVRIPRGAYGALA